MTAYRAQGVVLKLGDGQPTEVFTTIGEVSAVSGIGGGSATEIDVTTLSSSAKEFLMGLKDEGEVSVTLNLDTGDAQQTALRTARDNVTLKNFELDLTDTGPTTLSFSAYVKTFSLGVAVDQQITLEMTLRVTGPITWA